MKVVEWVVKVVDLYVFYIGSFLWKKYLNFVYWYFKCDKVECGFIDVIYWDIKLLFWLMICYCELDWVKKIVLKLKCVLERELKLI